MSEHSAPPEADLIEQLRRAARPSLSVRKAAEAAGMSEGRWRQIIKGYNQATKSTAVPTRAPDETLARMAHVVGAAPDQLRETGREDAALELERLITEQLRATAIDYHAMLEATITQPPRPLAEGEVPSVYGMVSYESAVELAMRLERASTDLPPGVPREYAANIDTAAYIAESIAANLINSPTLVREVRRKVAELIRTRDTELAAQRDQAIRAAQNPIPPQEVSHADRSDSADTPAATEGAAGKARQDQKNPEQMTPEQLRALTDQQLRELAGTDEVWVDYIRTRRPELARDLEF